MRVLFVNAGTHPELIALAAHCAESGDSVSYASASSLAPNHFILRLAQFLPRRIRTQLNRRKLPPELDRKTTYTWGLSWEIIRMLGPARFSDNLIRRRNAYLERRVASHWSNTPVDVLIVQSGSADAHLLSSMDTKVKVLNLPIPHHRWMSDRLNEEATANPKWAPFLQHRQVSAEIQQNYDDEIRAADYIVVASGSSAASVAALGVPRCQVIEVALGVDLEGSRQQEAEDLPSEFTVMYAGQINQRKGISYLISATEALGMKLRIVGHGDAPILEQIQAHNHVSVQRPVDRARLYSLMRAAHVFVLPSIVEGFGLVGLEALANGVAVIATDATFAADVMTDGQDGFVVPPGDSKAIEGRLRQLRAEPKLRERIGRQGRHTALGFTWEHYAASLRCRIDQALSEHE